MKAQEKLLLALANGSEKAFDTIFREYFNDLFHFAMKFLKDRQDAEDACADVFTMVWENRGKFRSIRYPKTYLMTSIRNECLDRLRASAARLKREEEMVRRLEQIGEPEHYAEIFAEFAAKENLRRQIDKLPEQCRIVFTLSFFDGLSAAEIAEKMRITQKTVDNHRRRAIKLLIKVKDLLVASAGFLF
jgi:RNA polymerase sigma-70 factor (ECF subfamily)